MDCDFLPYYFIWSTEDTQQLYPNRLVGSSCVYKSVDTALWDWSQITQPTEFCSNETEFSEFLEFSKSDKINSAWIWVPTFFLSQNSLTFPVFLSFSPQKHKSYVFSP